MIAGQILLWLSIKYAFFALIAIGVNICLQAVASGVYGGAFEPYASMALGTLAALMVKYLLDKKYIFYFRTSGIKEDGRKFALYTAMGVATTLMFWGFEVSFDWAFGTKSMRYVGAVIGLTIGYFSKYQLDKRFVFKTKRTHVGHRIYPLGVDER